VLDIAAEVTNAECEEQIDLINAADTTRGFLLATLLIKFRRGASLCVCVCVCVNRPCVCV